MPSMKNSIISVTVVELTALYNVAYHLLARLQTLIACHSFNGGSPAANVTTAGTHSLLSPLIQLDHR